MTIPSASVIESAIEMQAQEDPRDTTSKVYELHVASGRTELSADYIKGYLLGFQTAYALAERGIKFSG